MSKQQSHGNLKSTSLKGVENDDEFCLFAALISIFSSGFLTLRYVTHGQNCAVLCFPAGVIRLTASKAAGFTAISPGCCLFLSASLPLPLVI